jgi:outer membrane protein assembly factor BamE
MYKSIICLFIALALSSCSIVHKPVIEQGNIITPDMVSQLHRGMSEGEVRDVMGNPVLVNTFSPRRVDYVYTFQKGNQHRTETRVLCVFQRGRLVDIQR